MKIISFQEALEKAYALDKKPKLLLGNGFSISFDKEIFTYDSLLKNAKDRNLIPDRLIKVFEIFQISYIEPLLSFLKNLKKVFSYYLDKETSEEKSKEINDEIERLKQILIETISFSHPSGPASISDEKYKNCCQFLSYFSVIYTLNYDLLLYWVIMKDNACAKSKFKDGFGYYNSLRELIWKERQDTTLFYLHGALHLQQKEDSVIKYSWTHNFINLISQVLSDIQRNKYPLFVSEGNYWDKQYIISGSPYLSAALRSFSQCDGVLFTHGWSLDENDWHIMQAIASSNISKIFISVHKSSSDIEQLKSSAEAIKTLRGYLFIQDKNKKFLEVYYYDAETANVWEPSCQEEASLT